MCFAKKKEIISIKFVGWNWNPKQKNFNECKIDY